MTTTPAGPDSRARRSRIASGLRIVHATRAPLGSRALRRAPDVGRAVDVDPDPDRRPGSRRATCPRRRRIWSRLCRPRSTIGVMPDRLYFTESDDANALIASDPMALLIGFALDQQVTVQKAFSGPLDSGSGWARSIAAALAAADLEPIFRSAPRSIASPASMAEARPRPGRLHPRPLRRRRRPRLDATRADAATLRANLASLPGIRRDEDQGARRRARQAIRGRGRAGPRPVASHARRRRLAAGARRLPGGQAGPQGRVVEGRAGAA